MSKRTTNRTKRAQTPDAPLKVIQACAGVSPAASSLNPAFGHKVDTHLGLSKKLDQYIKPQTTMTKSEKRSHRARDKLEAASKEYRWLYEMTTIARSGDADQWPAHIFVPIPALIPHIPDAIVRLASRYGMQAVQNLASLDTITAPIWIAAGLTWSAWRMTQGIYRFDPVLYQALIDTPASGDIPAEILMRMPEWCVYIETPGLWIPAAPGMDAAPLRGVWARHDIGGRDEAILVLTPDTDTGDQIVPVSQYLELGVGSLDNSLRSVLADRTKNGGWSIDQPENEFIAGLTSWLRPVLNLLLYLCADVEYTRRGKPEQPVNPKPTRTRRGGLRLFPAAGPTEWDVGVRLGAALRAAYQAAQTGGAGGEHSSPRGHVRRAHWHGFRSGPRKREDGTEIPLDARKFDLRWLPPIPINLGDIDGLPAVMRPVK